MAELAGWLKQIVNDLPSVRDLYSKFFAHCLPVDCPPAFAATNTTLFEHGALITQSSWHIVI